MPRYIRKKRYYNYHNKYCKKYLRIDFQYECAYCGTHEAESVHGLKSFEIDHFRPRNKFKTDPTIHNYDNLFYSCHICNGGKSDDWEGHLLNPCSDDIFGEYAHIRDEMDENFKLTPLTLEGANYIKILKLNQKTQRGIRKIRSRYQRKVEQRIQEQEKLLANLKQLESLQNDGTIDISHLLEELEKEMKGPYYDSIHDPHFDEELELLLEKTFSASMSNTGKYLLNKIYGDHDLDYELKIEDKLSRVYVRLEETVSFTAGIKQIKIPVDQARDWSTLTESIIVLLFDSVNRNIYFTSFNDYVSSHPITTPKLYTVRFNQNNELQQKKDEFLGIISDA